MSLASCRRQIHEKKLQYVLKLKGLQTQQFPDSGMAGQLKALRASAYVDMLNEFDQQNDD